MAFNPARKTNRGISNCAGSDFQVDGEQTMCDMFRRTPRLLVFVWNVEVSKSHSVREIITPKDLFFVKLFLKLQVNSRRRKLGLGPATKQRCAISMSLKWRLASRNCLWL
ncbi:Hypothetical_protein [Hexamita inflata]|uniref:Hypothetical_protein n=1 Tax=Hexamita inflata TaxID=28002 RepID=A0AA86TLZ9_9EUKA|nr:Hypothetical protein HINF_LOCUS9031 [Hexamita inflata]